MQVRKRFLWTRSSSCYTEPPNKVGIVCQSFRKRERTPACFTHDAADIVCAPASSPEPVIGHDVAIIFGRDFPFQLGNNVRNQPNQFAQGDSLSVCDVVDRVLKWLFLLEQGHDGSGDILRMDMVADGVGGIDAQPGTLKRLVNYDIRRAVICPTGPPAVHRTVYA